jgi:hypothetical protein
MAVGAEAENVSRHIRTVVGAPERTDVCAFRIGTRPGLKSRRAQLAAVIVEGLYVADDVRTPNNADAATNPLPPPPDLHPGRGEMLDRPKNAARF